MTAPDRGLVPSRRLSMGAEVQPGGGVHFRVWAASHTAVAVSLTAVDGSPCGAPHPLQPEGHGWFSAHVPHAGPGTLYGYLLDSDPVVRPDPASRWQPRGVHGPSCVVDPSRFAWTDTGWQGVDRADAVIYELHVGTFTREGTFTAAQAALPRLAALGITVVELMPVADFPGRFGWGYDGVALYAPARCYGTPEDLRAFVDRAHAVGIAVILDVVYNHVGPDGCVLGLYAAGYYTRRYANEWGESLNFDGPDAAPVRGFFVDNAGYWIDEFHLDGYRFDATQAIRDASPEHVLTAIARRVREAAGGRRTLLVAENDARGAALLRPVEAGGSGLDALWNDDFHHVAMAAADPQTPPFHPGFRGTARELVAAVCHGYLYQGQPGTRGDGARAYGLDLTPGRYVTFLQNHDQVANTAHGLRMHRRGDPATWRALTALLLLGPGIPLLFQGQEWADDSPFHFFADHHPALAAAVARGRAEHLAHFPRLRSPHARGHSQKPPAPHDPVAFEQSRVDGSQHDPDSPVYRLHRDLLALRAEDPGFRRAERVFGVALSRRALALRFQGAHGDRLLLVNLGPAFSLDAEPEPLLAPPRDARWQLVFSTHLRPYGGPGTRGRNLLRGSPGRSAAAWSPVG